MNPMCITALRRSARLKFVMVPHISRQESEVEASSSARLRFVLIPHILRDKSKVYYRPPEEYKTKFCYDIIECKEGLACQCDGCTCKNTWGGYDCECKADLLYIMEQDTCIDRNSSKFRWFLTLLVLAGVVGSGIAGYIFYKYRFRSYMDSEIMAIMSQYMPLDNQQNEVQPPRQPSSV
ncbi:hypothetical protein HHK36_000616 [Tetracentron sinense]|uniref:Uncharacterized protein n=1 Tax=Tetracentron sinense TaxID=13715 RepID=A0A835DQ64_TETSI|nr:hypothetical protein HHK36_000616 [Tetracentron sinense]